jgi:hypothetical protein
MGGAAGAWTGGGIGGIAIAGSFGNEADGMARAGFAPDEFSPLGAGSAAEPSLRNIEMIRVYSPGPLANAGSLTSGLALGIRNTCVAP